MSDAPAPEAALDQRPLGGIRVLEVANMIAGPSAGAILADLGAHVIKVEPPTGDILRGRGQVAATPGSPDSSEFPDPWWELDNRGKQSISIDLKSEEGIEIVHQLASTCDVFSTNLTIARQERFGMGVEAIHSVNPTCVHASITGYGSTGPAASQLAYDMTAFFARGGVQGLLGEPGQEPLAFRPGQGDHTSALALLSAILAALHLRNRTGEGQVVEVALFQVAAWTIASDMSASLLTGVHPERKDRASWPSPLTCRYRCGDERWVALCMPGQVDNFPLLADCLGHPEWVDDERFATPLARERNAAAMIALADEAFLTADRATWAERLNRAGITWAPVQDLIDLAADPQAEALGMFATVDDGPSGPFQTINTPFAIRGSDTKVRGRAPHRGEHTRSVLHEAGYPESIINDLISRGIVVEDSAVAEDSAVG